MFTMNVYIHRGTHDVIDIVIGNNHGVRIQDLGEVVCISHDVKIFGKDMNPIILVTAMGKIIGRIGNFKLGMATTLEEGKR